MAKLECTLQGDFDTILKELEYAAVDSTSSSLEDYSDFRTEHCRCAVRVFERYSVLGGNRVSLSITLLQDGDTILFSAISAGGSNAMFFKVNTFGEEAFLEEIMGVTGKYMIDEPQEDVEQ